MSLKLIYGEETYLVKQAADQLVKTAISEMGDLAVERFADQTEVEHIIKAVRSVSMFTPRKFIYVEGIPVIRPDYVDEAQAQLSDIPSGHELVFVMAGKPDKRKKFLKFLLDKAECQVFEKFTPWQTQNLVKWIAQRESDRGYSIHRQAIEVLVDLVGTDLWSITSNLDKMETYVGPGSKISVELVESLAIGQETDTFELLDGLRRKNRKLVFGALNSLRKPEDAFRLMSVIISHLRLMLVLKSQGTSSVSELAKLTQKSPFYLKKIVPDLGRWTWSSLRDAVLELHELEATAKSGAMLPVLGLETALSNIL